MKFNSPFGTEPDSNQISINSDAKIIFVSDVFVDQYVGGAELTTEALISKSPVPVQKILSKDITVALLEQGHQKHWVFGNFASMSTELIPTIVANLSYSILEYDYKYCRYRSPEKHAYAEKKPCDCENSQRGKMISAFYYGAMSLWWMSEDQLEHYTALFSFLREKKNTVLSSVFDDEFFVRIKNLREQNKNFERKGWIVLGSNSWIKGAQDAENWCKQQGHDYEVVWGLPYEQVLEKLARAEGFVFLPTGMDTCPRMVIEAKLLGCKLHMNDYVMHQDEEWFDTDNLTEVEEYLYGSRELFWRGILAEADYRPTISGYTTTRNCIEHRYPWRACIKSMLRFCDEVVVVDGGSTDGTWEELEKWGEEEEKLKVHKVERDWAHKRFAVFDGAQKAEARKRCTMEYCWQMDADELAPDQVKGQIINFCRSWPQLVDLVSFPVVEFWGSKEKVRVDVNPWKWRLSRNLPHITHGIPQELRKYDEDENLYAGVGTDGCDYVHTDTGVRIAYASFYTDEADAVRRQALAGDVPALKNYQNWYQHMVNALPSVHHHSWLDIGRKIHTYKNYWQKHWESLYNITQEDTAKNNMFFNKPWSEISEEDIDNLSSKLASEMGGWIFHAPVDFSRPTPHVKLNTD